MRLPIRRRGVLATAGASSPPRPESQPHDGASRPGDLEEVATIDGAGTGGVVVLDCGMIIFVLHACSSPCSSRHAAPEQGTPRGFDEAFPRRLFGGT